MRGFAFMAVAAFALPLPTGAETLRVLTTELPPFSFLEDGEPVGIELDILQYHAKANGLELRIIRVDHWKDLFAALERGEGDLVAAAVTITDERQSRFDFASPHFPVQMRLVHRKGESVNDVNELAHEKVGVLAGSTGAQAFAAVPDAVIVPLPSVDALFHAVSVGDVRAIASESADAHAFIETLGNLEMGVPLGELNHYGFPLPPGSTYRDSLSESIRRLKESGIFFRILEKYLGKRAVEAFQAGKP